MSLRPRNGAPNPGRGGDGRRARWSESPIPRVAKRRVRMTGQYVPPPTFVGGGIGTLTAGTATYTIPSTSLAAGDIVIAVASTIGGTFTAPAGWTTLVEGTVTTIGYWAGWLRLDGSDSFTISRSDTTSVAMVRSWRWTDAAPSIGVASTAATEGAAVSSQAVPTPTTGWVMPWQFASYAYTGDTYVEVIPTGDPTGTGYYWGQKAGSGAAHLWNSYPNDQVDPEGVHAGTLHAYSDLWVTPKTIELVTFAGGFTK